MNSIEKFYNNISNNKHICVGLDTDIFKIPKFLLKYEDPIFEFNKIIVDTTIDLASAYKLNLAFYEQSGIQGLKSLKKSIEYIGDRSFIIGDAKRGDIGNTSEMYAKALFTHLKMDASTINPYMGYDSIEPFLRFEDKLNFILVLTSNNGANDFEKLPLMSGKFLYQEVLSKVNDWNRAKNCGIVFGATQIEELETNISEFNEMPVLIPGVGAQGGDLISIRNLMKKHNYKNYLINSSRGIIYKDNSESFGAVARQELINLNKILIEN